MYQNALNQNSNKSYGGMKADEKTNYLNQSVFTGYIKGISSYIPSSIKSSIKKQIMNSPVTFEEKDTIVGTYFDECFIQGEKHNILINCYNNGFQVWDLNHTDGVKELISIRDGLIKFCKILKNPLDPDYPDSSFYGKRPLLAVVSGEDNSITKVSKNMVRIFSLQTTELISMYKFKSPIYNVLSNQHLILVVLKERIVGFNANDMSKIKGLSLPSYPSVTPLGVIALGSRWIAYTDYESNYSYIGGHNHSSHYFNQHHHHHGHNGQQRNSSVPQNQTFGDTAVDVASDIAKEVANKLYYFSDIGRKKVSSYLYPEDNTSPNSTTALNHNPTSFTSSSSSSSLQSMNQNSSTGNSTSNDKLPDAPCIIVVFDYVKQKIVTLIKPPHTHPISYLSFDPTGTLLFTSTTEGTKVNTYQIIPFTNSLTISSPPVTSSSNSLVLNSIVGTGNSSGNSNNLIGTGNSGSNNSSSSIVVTGNNSGNSGGVSGNNNINNCVSIISNSSGNSNNNNNQIINNNESSFRHIYILKRGITNASIQGISTNETSKWVALTTSRGTTHIFAINPLGGEVDIHSHITRSPNSKRPIDYYSSVNNLTPSLLTINAMDRIKLGNDNEESSMSSLNNGGCAMSGGNACFIESNQPNLENLFVVSPTGQLILYELRPQRPPATSEMLETTLCLSITPVAEWDVCRKTRSPEYKSPNIPYTLSAIDKSSLMDHHYSLNKDIEAKWLYNVEITTHSQDIRAIWGVPQFTFRSSAASAASSSSSSPMAGNEESVNFFDQDYPTGEVIKFEKRKNISPRIQDGYYSAGTSPNNSNINNNNMVGFDGGDYKSGSSFDNNPGSYFVNIKDEDDIEIIEKLNDAMKTPISTVAVPIPINNNNSNKFSGSGGFINSSSNSNSNGSNSNNNSRVGPSLNNNNNGNSFNNNNNNSNGFNPSNNNSNNNFNNSPAETDGLYLKKNTPYFSDSSNSSNIDLIPNPVKIVNNNINGSSGGGMYSNNNNNDNDDGGIGKFTGLGDFDEDDDDFPSYPALDSGSNNRPPIQIPLANSSNPKPISSIPAPLPVLPNSSGNGLPTTLKSNDNLPPPPVTPPTTTTTTTTTTTNTTTPAIPIPTTSSKKSPKDNSDSLASSFSSSSSTQSAASPTSPKPNLSSPPKSSSKKSSKK